MADVPATKETFQQRLATRIRESIGDLMTDEDLKKLVERGLDEMLFDKREKPDPQRSYSTLPVPPLMHELLKEALYEQIKDQVRAFVGQNNGKILEAVDQMLKEGAAKMMVRAINDVFTQSLENFRFNLANDMKNNNFPFGH